MRLKVWHYVFGAFMFLGIIIVSIAIFYMNHLDTLGKKELLIANEMLHSGNYVEALHHLDKVPKKSKVYDGIHAVKKQIEDNQTGDKEFQFALTLFEKGNFTEMNAHLKKIPKHSKAMEQASELLKKDPTRFSVENYLPPTFKVEDTTYIMLNQQTPSIIVSGKDTNPKNPFAYTYIYYYDDYSANFKLGYTTSNEYYVSEDKYIVKSGNMFENEYTNGIAISFLSYGASGWAAEIEVIGLDESKKKIVSYLKKSTWKGSVEILDGYIVVEDGETTYKYEWNGSTFQGQKITIEPVVNSNDIRFTYTLLADGTLQTSTDSLTIKLGQRVVLIRDDELTESLIRIMSLNSESQEEIITFDSDNGVVGNIVGTTELTFVPDYADWDNAVNLTIKVIE